jgi:hypothetical protein
LILWVVIYSRCGDETSGVRDSTPKRDAKNEMQKFSFDEFYL